MKFTHQKYYKYIRITCLLGIISIIIGCNSGSVNKQKDINPEITNFTAANLSKAATDCYNDPLGYSSQVGAVNNNGVVAGAMQVKKSDKCIQQSYMWGNDLKFIPLVNNTEKFTITGTRLSVISTNLITGGITFAEDSQLGAYEFATYNNIMKPFILDGYNYVLGISENGQYLVGINLGGQPLNYDTVNESEINLTYNGEPAMGMFVTVSNKGLIGASIINKGANNDAALCQESSGICTAVTMDESKDMAFITSIASQNQYIFGFYNKSGDTSVFSVNPDTYKGTTIAKLKGFIANENSVTDKGALIASNGNNSKQVIYLSQNDQMYSVSELVNKLNLTKSIAHNSIAVSPNGKYISFDVKDYNSNILMVKVYFPNGIEEYLLKNIKPLS